MSDETPHFLMIQNHEQTIKHVADALSAGAIIGAILGHLPAIGAGLGVIWYCLQIYWAISDRMGKNRERKRRRTDE